MFRMRAMFGGIDFGCHMAIESSFHACPNESSDATIRASLATRRVGCIAGANLELWLPGGNTLISLGIFKHLRITVGHTCNSLQPVLLFGLVPDIVRYAPDVPECALRSLNGQV
jgi:hypothetical protein